ncbi:MAG: SDR family oxidoreductase [Sulfurospirillaceae bacterium]|nr:SDR family oxidoreductase [Sulfurospirillaceae bacterium]MCK9545704.1 SDR family oxidoreductase [Sulfurospirillaceae bacterium]MDY0238939.1 SDR family oxidoreductase [Campylobacterales bacterium]
MSQIIVITGTSRGIGKALAKHYLDKNNTVIGCSRGEASITHPNYKHFSLKVDDEGAVVSMIRQIRREFGRIDVLLNNAGIASMNHFLTTSTTTVSKIFDTNFLGTFIFSREVSKVMMKQKNGRIVNFTTVAKPLNLDGEAIYASSKAAIESLTKISAKELAPFNITVNAIGPTPIKTDLIKAVPKEKMDDLLEKQAIKRFGEFEDIINVVDFFCKKESDFITAQVIYLGGVSS